MGVSTFQTKSSNKSISAKTFKAASWAVLQFVYGFAFVSAIALIIAMAGCAQMGNLPAPGIHPGDAPITQREFVRADVQAALDIAKQGNDVQGIPCYTAWLAVLPADAQQTVHPTGAISIFEAGRVARITVQSGLPDSVVSACAPLVVNSNAALLNAIMFLRP